MAFAGGLRIKAGIEVVDVFLIQPFLRQPQRLTEALEVHDLPGPEELDGVADVRVVGKAENVVVGNAGFLLCCDGVRTTFPKTPPRKPVFCYSRIRLICDCTLPDRRSYSAASSAERADSRMRAQSACEASRSRSTGCAAGRNVTASRAGAFF